jgi:hypothetical protein
MQTMSARKAQHLFQAKTRPWGVRDLLQKRYSLNDLKFEVLEETDDSSRYIRELHWLKQFKCVNKCLPGKGPLGFKVKTHQLERVSKAMTGLWKNDRDGMLERVNSHKTKAFQKMASAASHKAKYDRLPLMEVLRDGKILGQYKTKRELADSTAARYLSGRLKVGAVYKHRRVVK